MKYLIIYWIWVIQFHMNNSTHAIPQKHLDEFFCSNKWKCVKKTIVEFFIFFEMCKKLS
jgi:hypothetical protein